MRKSDVIRGLKAELKSIEDSKLSGNIDYQRGKIDQLRSLIRDLNHPIECQKFMGMVSRLPSRELK